MLVQAKDVGGRGDQAVSEEFLDPDEAETGNVEGVARDEMDQAFHALRRADQAAGAADDDLALLASR